MGNLRFEWDNRKAAGNKKKHRVSFEEAASVFLDQNARVYFDPDHSEEEDRYLIRGMSRSLRVLVIAYCYRSRGTSIRLISARRADTEETRLYFDRRES